jgi:serine/threonine protein phosphatase PrpC
MKFSVGAFSDVGRSRDDNEDAYVVDERLVLFAIADGMGGHRGGEVASWTAIEALRAAVANGNAINLAISKANEAVIERAAGDPEVAGMGTTMTAVVPAAGRTVLIGHVGDSRAYLLHDGTLSRLTDDHSLVEEMVREGRLTHEQAESHPRRNIVTRALGQEHDVEVDLYTLEVSPGDRILLCSDGLTVMVRDRDVERIVRGESDPQRAVELLVDAANEAGGEDNITVILLDVLEVEEAAPPDPDSLATPTASATPISIPAPDVAPGPPPPEARPSLRRRVRSALFVIVPLVLILGFAFLALGYYARRSYFVGLDGNQVVVYRGVPGGVLGWDPTVEAETELTVDDLIPSDAAAVGAGTARGSRDRADNYVVQLEERATTTTTSTSTSTTTTSTTTTTLPAPPPVPAAPPAVPAP